MVGFTPRALICGYTSCGEEASLEHIRASDLYPKPQMVSDDPSLHVPHPLLNGEGVRYLGKVSDGPVSLTNFRIFIRLKDSFVNVPLGLIESVEYRDIFYIYIFTKDARSYRITFSTNESCLEWYRRLSTAIGIPNKLEDVFAFTFHAWSKDTYCRATDAGSETELCFTLSHTSDEQVYSFGKEVERLGFDLKAAWRITYINENYKVCRTYPKLHIVPACVEDKELTTAAAFRACHRFPSVVWRNPKNGAVIARGSQPEVGWFGWRNREDEAYLQGITTACHVNQVTMEATLTGEGEEVPESVGEEKKLLIMDARSYTAAVANRAKGGGCECPEYYPNSEIQFMNLANIHAIRKSFQALRALCSCSPDQPNWLSALENCKWLHHISMLLRSSLLIVKSITEEGRPVLIHCSDGWDRTPQLSALAQLMMDPYYRTIEGFQVLVEKEWLEFGHKFADRCGVGLGCEDINERCPVFLQWLDCVHQMLNQFPCAFQFNHNFLVKLGQHTYSCLFGTFLCNTAQEREDNQMHNNTCSVWTLLNANMPAKFVNCLYIPDTQENILRPSYHTRDIRLWNAMYLSETTPATGFDEPLDFTTTQSEYSLSDDNSSEKNVVPKTRSCEDLVSAVTEHNGQQNTRRLSDPNIIVDPTNLGITTDTTPESGKQDSTEDKPAENAESAKNDDDNEMKLELSLSDKRLELTNGGGVSFKVSESSYNETPTNGDVSSINVNNCSDKVHHRHDDDEVKVHHKVCIDESEGHNSDNTLIVNGDGPNCDTNTRDSCDVDTTARDTCSKRDTAPQPRAIQNGPLPVDGSTDTLTEEADIAASDSRTSQNSSHTITCSPQSLARQCEKAMLADTAHMSTSTSDISDSRVPSHKDRVRLEEALLNLDVDWERKKKCGIVVDVGLASRESSGVSCADSHDNSPQPSSASSGLGSPTPTDNKASCLWLTRQTSGVSRHLDIDGLTPYTDTVHQRMNEIVTDLHSKLRQKDKQLNKLKNLLYYNASLVNGRYNGDTKDEILSTDSQDSEHKSCGGGSNAASDISWEQLEEKDAHMTLWVPDHAVTHCAGCHNEFWIVRRKHHCRNCGQVFCNECTNIQAPVPQQQLTQPVRVCVKCFKSISHIEDSIFTPLNDSSIAELEAATKS